MAGVGRRQVGSTIKPYLYSLAMENGFTPCDETRNIEQTLVTEDGKLWSPRNSTRNRYGEIVTLRWGLATSNNWISAYLMSKLNPYSFKKIIHQFGLLNKEIEATPSLCLGACDASVAEMVAAYTAFVGKGIRTSPLMVTRIEDNAGNVVASFSARKTEVISEESSYKMIEMLRAVINEGTGGRVRRVYGITADMGGKTGTTQNNSDGWFMGFTPSLVTGCWVGGEERDIHFDNMTDGQGAAMALPIWGLYMKKVFADESLPYSQDETFDIPEDFDPCGSRPWRNPQRRLRRPSRRCIRGGKVCVLLRCRCRRGAGGGSGYAGSGYPCGDPPRPGNPSAGGLDGTGARRTVPGLPGWQGAARGLPACRINRGSGCHGRKGSVPERIRGLGTSALSSL